DLRTVTYDVPPQEILTKDSVTVTVDAVIYFKIFDPVASVINVENAQWSTQLLAATTLRNELGTRSLQEILTSRDQISENLRKYLDRQTDPWGITVELVEIKDVSLPFNMQRAMAAEAEATRDAKAKIIAADGEFKASKALKEASDVISSSGTALQLRYLQTLTQISAEKNSTIIFPIPMEMLKEPAVNSLVKETNNYSDLSINNNSDISENKTKKDNKYPKLKKYVNLILNIVRLKSSR
ncbi:hypothetical protein SNEBB_000454, partial [Seison nebaliae]